MSERVPSSVFTRNGEMFNGFECRWSNVYTGLTEDQAQAVHDAIRAKDFPRGTTLFNLGDSANDILIVLTGRIKCSIVSQDGVIFTPGLYGSDRLTGLLSALRAMPRMVTVETIDDSRIGSLSRRDLHRLMIDIPVFGENVAKLAASMAADLIWVLSERALAPAKHRLLNILLSLSTSEAASGEDAWVVRGLSQEELAAAVGVSRTWVNLTLTEMESEGLISRRRLEIRLLDPMRMLSELKH